MTRSRKQSRNQRGLSLSYSGPVRLSTRGGQDSAPIRSNLSYSFFVDTDPSGIATNIIRGPGLTTCSDWADYAQLYQEFRVLAMEFRYMPYFNGSYDSTLVQGSGASAVVHIPLAIPPITLDEVVTHNTWKMFRTSVPTTVNWKMFGVEESPFTDVASVSSTNHGGIIYWVDGLTPNNQYGKGVVTYLVEFRGRK